MSAPRIDTVRRNLNDVIHHIAQALDNLEDLHALAYDRHRAAEQIRVSGGDPTAVGMNLDTHGDKTARAAYEQLAHSATSSTTRLTSAITAALATFDPGIIRARRDQTADSTTAETIAAMAAHQKRHQNGDPGSVALLDQPLPKGATRALDATRLQAELDNLRAAVRKSGIRPDRARLTPLELTAWQTAAGTTPKRRKRR